MINEKILVVYYSNSGHTKKLAKEIAKELNCAIEEIKTTASYDGFIGYQRALFHALFRSLPKIKKLKHNPLDYELIVLGGPVWGWSAAGPVRTFLNEYKNSIKKISFFLTQGSPYGKSQVFEQMGEVADKTPLAILSVTDKKLIDDSFKENVATYITKIHEKLPSPEKKKINKHHARPIRRIQRASSLT